MILLYFDAILYDEKWTWKIYGRYREIPIFQWIIGYISYDVDEEDEEQFQFSFFLQQAYNFHT